MCERRILRGVKSENKWCDESQYTTFTSIILYPDTYNLKLKCSYNARFGTQDRITLTKGSIYSKSLS